MNKLTLETRNNRLLYRELFVKANDGVKKQINAIKSPSNCKKCRICCQVRYSELSPDQVFELASQGDEISKQYLDLFLPYGAGEDFNYESNNAIDIELNNKLASQKQDKYVENVLNKSNMSVYFYFCKHLSDQNKCEKYGNENFLCTSFPNSATTVLPYECGYREWQKSSLDLIKNVISKDILIKLKEIDEHRKNFSCKKTGTCCRLASSEFSYEELKEKAKNGDKFASDFVSVFIPYENAEDAREIYPEFVDMLFAKLDKDEKVYFYHCPHVSDDNLCTIYEKRPDVCRDFPNNPLSILPPQCGFCAWKDDVYVAAMFMHALIEICDFNIGKIEAALKD